MVEFCDIFFFYYLLNPQIYMYPILMEETKTNQKERDISPLSGYSILNTSSNETPSSPATSTTENKENDNAESYIDIDDEVSLETEETKKAYWKKLETLQINPFFHKSGNSSEKEDLNTMNDEKGGNPNANMLDENFKGWNIRQRVSVVSGFNVLTEEELQLLEERENLIESYFADSEDDNEDNKEVVFREKKTFIGLLPKENKTQVLIVKDDAKANSALIKREQVPILNPFNDYDKETQERYRNAITWLIRDRTPRRLMKSLLAPYDHPPSTYKRSEDHLEIQYQLMNSINTVTPWWYLNELPAHETISDNFYYEVVSKEFNGRFHRRQRTVTYYIVDHELVGKQWDITFDLMNPKVIISFQERFFDVPDVTDQYLKICSGNYSTLFYENALRLLKNKGKVPNLEVIKYQKSEQGIMTPNDGKNAMDSFESNDDFINYLFDCLPSTALPRIGKQLYGIQIYHKINQFISSKREKIRLGDILIIDQGVFKLKVKLQPDSNSYRDIILNNLPKTKKVYTHLKVGFYDADEEFSEELFVGIIIGSDSLRKELKAVHFVKNEGLVTNTFKLHDLECGILKVFRPVGKDILPWSY